MQQIRDGFIIQQGRNGKPLSVIGKAAVAAKEGAVALCGEGGSV